MKTTISICTLILLGVLSGCSSTPANSTDSEPRIVNMDGVDQRRVMLFFEEGSEEPFTGQIVQRYYSGEIRMALDIVDGLAVGKATEWFESGQKKGETVLVGGEPRGSATAWYENGQKESERLIEDGETMSVVAWYETGQMRSQETYVNGRPSEEQTWYENGQMRSHTTSIRRPDEVKRTWDEDGVETTVRPEIEDALMMSGGAKAAVAEYYHDRGELPADNKTAGLSDDPSYFVSRYVTGISVDNGVIAIALGNSASADFAGRALVLTPVTTDWGSVSWTCSSPDIDPSVLPEMCK